MDSSSAFFWVGYLLGICSLALFTAIYKALKPDGVRALKLPISLNELFVLRSVQQLGGLWTGVSTVEISESLEQRREQRLSTGEIFVACDSLELYGYLYGSLLPGGKERNGRPLRIERLTTKGVELLQSANAVNPQTAIDSSEERQQKERLNL